MPKGMVSEKQEPARRPAHHLNPIFGGDIEGAPKGPRAHTMSPPLLGYCVLKERSLLAEQCFQQRLPRNAQMLSDVAKDGTRCADP